MNPDVNGDGKPLEDTATVLMLANPVKPPVKVPTGFSPNGDGLNDGYYIENPKGFKLYFAVYNRWGNIIYESQHYDNSWKGDAEKGVVVGDKVPDGTYFYILEFTDEFDIKHKSTGFLTIAR
jgi:gliding motility-associated-like protein